MDAGRIAGSVINTAIAEYAPKAAETRPEHSTASAQQWDLPYTLQISNEAYSRYSHVKGDISAQQTAAAEPVSAKKKSSLEDAMTSLSRFTQEQEHLVGDSDLYGTVSEELQNALEQFRQHQQENSQNSDGSPSDTSPDTDEQFADAAESKAAVRRKMQQLSRGIRKPTDTVPDLTTNSVYNEARKNLTLAKQEDHVLRNNLSALYRYVIQDENLSAKDKADAINRFVAEGRQTLSRIEKSLNYSLAQMRSIESLRQARQDIVSAGMEQDSLLNVTFA